MSHNRRQKTWKEIEISRNRRLWITGVAIPVAGMFVTLYARVPGFRREVNEIPHKVKVKWAHVKNRVTAFHKKE